MDYLDFVVAAQKYGQARAITSVCSANPLVLEAALKHGLVHNIPVLIEATCNQVNQFGGYTGMTPLDFARFVYKIAGQVGFPVKNLILGGDHLGPLVWSNEPAEEAMRKARHLVRAYVQAGMTKIHLDCSMPCADDRDLPVELVARRAAELAAAAEAAVAETAVAEAAAQETHTSPRYVIGTEVPAAGGAKAGEDHLTITKPEDAATTIDLARQAFRALGLQAAWERVIALVVQPGVEFGDESVHVYNREAASSLVRFIEPVPGLVYEAHSTDYQPRSALRALVEDHFAILKVGPALTFALREAIFALAEMEDVLVEQEVSHIREALETAMLEKPGYWQKHYAGSPKQLKFARSYSFSDRIRYYWPLPSVQTALERLLHNLGDNPLPLSLLSQYLPRQYEKVRLGELKNHPRELMLAKVMDVLDDYQVS